MIEKLQPNFIRLNWNFKPQAVEISQPKWSLQSSQENFVKAPTPTLLAYLTKVSTNTDSNVAVSFSCFDIQNMSEELKNQAISTVRELNSRLEMPKGQVLNWINILPEEQLSRLDEIYNLADWMKQNGSKKLGIIGIGGSKHTIENMLSLNNKNEDIVFLSAVDPDSMNKFIRKLGNLNETAIIVASKSGTTLEPSTGYDFVEKAFLEKFKNDYIKNGCAEDIATMKANSEIAKHFVCITDGDSSKSKLRQIANEKGYKCGIIHDECGGRFGAFDDHSLTALAWAGLSKIDMKKMLEASLKAQKRFLSSNLSQNIALQRALFNTKCVLDNKIHQHDYYFGDSFEGTKLWNTQLKKESHKSLYKVCADLIGPEFLHNCTESDLDEGDKNSFYTFTKIKNDRSEIFKSYNALIDGAYIAYSQRHPVSVIELKDLSPESIAEFVELKHFETLYTGMLLRALKNKELKNPEILPEVLQPNVGIYKKEVNKILKN